MLKEKERVKTVPYVFAMFFFCLVGAAVSGAYGSGANIPISLPLTAILPPIYGMCVFIGSASSYIFSSSTAYFLTDIIAMPVMIFIRFFGALLGKKKAASFSLAACACAVYFAAGISAAFASKITAALIAAIIFRSIICGIVSYFASEFIGEIKDCGKISVTGEKAVGTAVMYVLAESALGKLKIGNFCIGRIAGVFVILAAGGKFGGAGSAAAGALTALGMILGDADGSDLSDMIRSSSMISSAGLISGYFGKKNRTAAAAAFSVSALVFSLFMGRIRWTETLMADTLIAAAFYSLIPDRLYMKAVNGTIKSSSPAFEYCSENLAFVSEVIENTGESVSKASEFFKSTVEDPSGYNAYDKFCGRICSSCRNKRFCTAENSDKRKYMFARSMSVIDSKGYITEQDISAITDLCTQKAALAEFMNESRIIEVMERGAKNASGQLSESICEQLFAVCDMLKFIGEGFIGGKIYDEALAAAVSDLIVSLGGKNPSSTVFFDKSGHIYISCFFQGEIKSDHKMITEKISRIADRELDEPETFSCGERTRLCFHEPTNFIIETGKASVKGCENISGDNFTEFSDGEGNVYFIISDGMGSGERAAAESKVTVSLLSKLIKAGIGANAAVRFVNLMLISKSSDEVFSTADILRINLFSGKAEVIKLGAAQTLFCTGGIIKSAESRTLPAGIVSHADFEKTTLRLSDGDSAVMLSDGIGEETLPKIRELMLSNAYSPKQCAEAAAEYDISLEKERPDDRTIIFLKLHEI